MPTHKNASGLLVLHSQYLFKFNNKSRKTVFMEIHSGSYRSSHQRCSIKKVFLKISQNLQENTCARVSFLIKLQASVCHFIKKETLALLFSCEFFEISKNTFFREHLWATASVLKFDRLHVI